MIIQKINVFACLTAVLGGLALVACQAPQDGMATADLGHQDAQTAQGAQIYAQYCVTCHGSSATGDGPIASQLPTPPADLTRLAAANAGRFPMEQVMAKIHGYPDHFHAEVMPQFGTLLDGPVTDYVDASGASVKTPLALLELARYLESLQQG